MSGSYLNLSNELGAALASGDIVSMSDASLLMHVNLATLEQELLDKKHALLMAEAAAINSGQCEGKNAETREALLHGLTAGERKDVLMIERQVVFAKAKLEAVRWAKQLLVANLSGGRNED